MAEPRDLPPDDPSRRPDYADGYPGGEPARAPRSSRPPERRGASNALIVIPLIVVALVLVWFIWSRGEPASPIEGMREREAAEQEAEAPVVDIDIPVVERIETPSVEERSAPDPATPPSEPQPDPSPDPSGPAPATPPNGAPPPPDP